MSPAKKRSSGEGTILTHNKLIACVIGRAAAIRAAGIEPDPALLEVMAAYCGLLLRWNRKISLTSITDPAEIVSRHFLESFYGARWLETDAGTLCDVGSGAGFPGLALKLVRPRWRVRLFELNLKKAAFLAEAARQLKLEEVEVVRERWQDAAVAPNSVEVVSARAVGNYEEIVDKAHEVLKPNGRLLLWLGAADSERLRQAPGWKWENEFLPGSRERVLLVGTPVR
jgi:16S rRNA (guanine527-N7)-methyltransferase